MPAHQFNLMFTRCKFTRYKSFSKKHSRSVAKPLLGLVLLTIATGCRSAQPPTAQTSPEPSKPALSPSAAPTAIAAAPSASAPAAPVASPSRPLNCDNPQGQAASCAQGAYESADALLNQTYQQLKNGLSRKDQQQLVEAETAWISFRDRSCEFERSLVSSATQPRAFYECLQKTTADRTAELKAQATTP